MQKYLNLKGTAVTAFEGNQLVSINGIKTIRCTTATGVDTLMLLLAQWFNFKLL